MAHVQAPLRSSQGEPNVFTTGCYRNSNIRTLKKPEPTPNSHRCAFHTGFTEEENNPTCSVGPPAFPAPFSTPGLSYSTPSPAESEPLQFTINQHFPRIAIPPLSTEEEQPHLYHSRLFFVPHTGRAVRRRSGQGFPSSTASLSDGK